MDFTRRENYKLMSNLEKSVAINLENTAHYENISNLDITFRTGESDSSVLLFNITKNNQPLLLSEENIKARIAIRGKGVMVVAPLEILDPFKGILKFQLPNDVIKRDGSYQAQVSVAELGNSDVVVVERTITFNVEKSLFSKIPSETKLHYIVEFQELEKTIMDRAKAMDEAIKNGEDYASLIEKAKEKGLSDIQIAKSSSIDELKHWFVEDRFVKNELETKREHINFSASYLEHRIQNEHTVELLHVYLKEFGELIQKFHEIEKASSENFGEESDDAKKLKITE